MKFTAKEISTDKAPKAIGPYSQGVRVPAAEEIIFVSGQLPINPLDGKLITENIAQQASLVIDNMEAILEASGSSLQRVLRVDIFLTDLKRDFQAVNEEYARRFSKDPKPARQTIQAAALPLGSSIEMSCIAYKGA